MMNFYGFRFDSFNYDFNNIIIRLIFKENQRKMHNNTKKYLNAKFDIMY